MKMHIRIRGLKTMQQQLDTYGRDIRETAKLYVNDVADVAYENALEGILNGPKSGHVYRRYNPFRLHQASAPGQYPADDLGNLAASIEVTHETTAQNNVRATVGSNLVYGTYLEFGTSKMAARPWLKPSIEDARIEMSGELRATFRRVRGVSGGVMRKGIRR